MKCQICNKNEANIIFTQIVNNEKIVKQICSECAKKKGLSIEIESVSPKPASPEMLLGLFSGETEMKEEKDIPELKCDLCGLTFSEFKKSGLFGCDKCHEAFGERIKDIIKQSTKSHKSVVESIFHTRIYTINRVRPSITSRVQHIIFQYLGIILTIDNLIIDWKPA